MKARPFKPFYILTVMYTLQEGSGTPMATDGSDSPLCMGKIDKALRRAIKADAVCRVGDGGSGVFLSACTRDIDFEVPTYNDARRARASVRRMAKLLDIDIGTHIYHQQ